MTAPTPTPALDPLDRMLKPAEAAQWLRMSKDDYLRKTRAGVIKTFHFGHKQVLAHPRTIIACKAAEAGVKPEVIAAMFTLPPSK